MPQGDATPRACDRSRAGPRHGTFASDAACSHRRIVFGVTAPDAHPPKTRNAKETQCQDGVMP